MNILEFLGVCCNANGASDKEIITQNGGQRLAKLNNNDDKNDDYMADEISEKPTIPKPTSPKPTSPKPTIQKSPLKKSIIANKKNAANNIPAGLRGDNQNPQPSPQEQQARTIQINCCKSKQTSKKIHSKFPKQK